MNTQINAHIHVHTHTTQIEWRMDVQTDAHTNGRRIILKYLTGLLWSDNKELYAIRRTDGWVYMTQSDPLMIDDERPDYETYLLIKSITYWHTTLPLSYSFTRSLIRSAVRSLSQLIDHTFRHVYILTNSFTCWLVHSLTLSLNY